MFFSQNIALTSKSFLNNILAEAILKDLIGYSIG